jgi:arsenite methyltransferase
MTDQTTKIHDAVREQYGAFARKFKASQTINVSAGCCETSADATNDTESCGCGCGSSSEATLLQIADDATDVGYAPVQLYDDQNMLIDLPEDVTGMSLGCGDPVTIAGFKPGERVLDLGSGGGIDCFLAAKQVGEEGYVIGVDMTTEMLTKANANKATMDVTNVEFRRGHIEDLPVKDNDIDVIMSNCVINLSPDKSAVFKESFRVLKPGGRVSISDIVTEGSFSPEKRAELNSWAGCVTGAIDLNDYTDLMREAGFVNIEVVSKVGGIGGVGGGDDGSDSPKIYSARITANKPE